MKALIKTAVTGAALGIVGSLSLGSIAMACSAEDLEACKGKPWVDGDKMETPLGSKWWPHPMWGEGDEAGSTNWYTKPEVIQRALAANGGNGKTYKLGHPYTVDMPLFGARKFSLRINEVRADVHCDVGAKVGRELAQHRRLVEQLTRAPRVFEEAQNARPQHGVDVAEAEVLLGEEEA